MTSKVQTNPLNIELSEAKQIYLRSKGQLLDGNENNTRNTGLNSIIAVNGTGENGVGTIVDKPHFYKGIQIIVRIFNKPGDTQTIHG